MKHRRVVLILVLFIAVMAAIAAAAGILSDQGPGPYEYESIRGQIVEIYGRGIYRHMSAEVAVQGIAQDYVTLLIAIPLMLISFFYARRGSLKALFLLTGTLGYFLVTYLFYTAMGMYNVMFLGYVSLLAASFFAFILIFFSISPDPLPGIFRPRIPIRLAGGFLMFNAVAIAFLWLSMVVPPLLDGTIIPPQVEHYTTLIVQGFDLGLLLPAAFVSGLLAFKKRPYGYLLTTTYLIFLSIMMMALTAKIIAMGIIGVDIIPVVFIIPTFTVFAIALSTILLRGIRVNAH